MLKMQDFDMKVCLLPVSFVLFSRAIHVQEKLQKPWHRSVALLFLFSIYYIYYFMLNIYRRIEIFLYPQINLLPTKILYPMTKIKC